MLFGIPCIIADQIKIQKKTSKYKIVNWLYKKIYGYKYESTMPEGADIVCFDDEIVFRNKEVFDKVKEQWLNSGCCYELQDESGKIYNINDTMLSEYIKNNDVYLEGDWNFYQ